MGLSTGLYRACLVLFLSLDVHSLGLMGIVVLGFLAADRFLFGKLVVACLLGFTFFGDSSFSGSVDSTLRLIDSLELQASNALESFLSEIPLSGDDKICAFVLRSCDNSVSDIFEFVIVLEFRHT